MQGRSHRLDLTHLTYACLGISFLWPWNAMLTASLLANQKLALSPGLLNNYSSSVMTASTTVALLANMGLVYYSGSYFRRVKWGETIIIACFALMALFGGLFEGAAWFLFLVAVAASSSLGCSLVQNGTLAITQRIPGATHALAVTIGQGIAGVIPPLVPLIMGNVTSTLIATFTFSSVSLLAFIALFLFGMKQNQEYISLSESETDVELNAEAASSSPKLNELVTVLKSSWKPYLTMLLAYLCTLSYPVFANRVKSQSMGQQQYFSPLTHLIWNLGDLGGRIICSVPKLRMGGANSMLVASVLRFLIIWVLLALVHMDTFRDYVYLLVMLFYGLSNGYLVSSAITYTSTCVSARFQPTAGGLIGLTITVGLALGSLSSFVTSSLL